MVNLTRLRALIALAIGVLALAQLPALAQSAGPLSQRTRILVQLNWLHQFEFAAFYAAKAQGFYAAEGLDVEVREGQVGTSVVSEVISQRAHFGVGNSSLLLDREQGEPVVALAALMQQSPIALMARRDKGMKDVRDLLGKTLMVPPHAFDEIRAFLSASGLEPNQMHYVPMSRSELQGRLQEADAVEIYTTNEGFVASKAPDQYVVWATRDAGLDFYGNVLFTSQYLLKSAPDLVHKFRKATLKGMSYALEHPSEIADLIQARYNTQAKSREHLLYEAGQIKEGNLGHLVDDGYMSANRWKLIARTYAGLGLMREPVVPEDFVYAANIAGYRIDHLVRVLLATLAGLALILAVAAYIVVLNRRLKRSLSDLGQANARLAHLAQHDVLTQLANRSLFGEHLSKSLDLARRNKSHLAVLVIDVDDFKSINDTHGHAVGDLVLQTIATRLKDHVRHADVVGRLGGDEFVVLLPQVTNEQGALQLARHLREQVYQPIVDGVRVFRVNLSIGVAVFPQHGLDGNALMLAADAAMYQVKSAHAHQVCLAERADAGSAGSAGAGAGAGVPEPDTGAGTLTR